MSNQGDKTCPLCAEEMDLTDQQLKPCTCGYDICVWCWHHIMDMAEKDESEGRCPACRTPYDKDKIAKAAENCGRLVAEFNTDRKIKSQKTKTNKSFDGRKQLSNMRVIRRNLVYVVGFPFDLTDEEHLHEKEYFGQYGKVLKVSMSRTTAGLIQHFPNNCCNVYITYSKEEEAIRCIQSVHGFVLDGRPLKACFGTTKYCHAWLRNMPCTNLDCLYLHEVGRDEDRFTKDEIVAGCTRGRVQQITGVTNNLQLRSGDMLPPPSDDFYIDSASSCEKPPIRNASNDSATIVRVSPPNSSSGRSTALPAGASWGARASNFQQPVASAACSNGHSKQNLDNFSAPLGNLSSFSGNNQTSTENGDLEKKVVLKEGHATRAINIHSLTTASKYQVTDNGDPSKAGHRMVEVNDAGISVPPEIFKSDVVRVDNRDPSHVMNRFVSDNRKIVCSETGSMSIDTDLKDNQTCVTRHDAGTNSYYTELVGEQLESATVSKTATKINNTCVTNTHDWSLNSHSHVSENAELEDDLQSFNDQRLKDPEFISPYAPRSDHSLHRTNHSRESSMHYTESYREANINADPTYGHRHSRDSLPHSYSSPRVYNGYPEDLYGNSNRLDRDIEHPYMPSDERNGNQMYRLQSDASNYANMGMGENNTISNIMSMDFDTWDDPLTSSQKLDKLLGETNKQPGFFVRQNSIQSRFSFARPDESKSQELHTDSPFNMGQLSRNHSYSQDFGENRVPYPGKLRNGNSFSTSDMEEYNKIRGSQAVFPSSNLSVSKSQASAPPGFSVPSRAPPPGFSSHERIDPSFDALSVSKSQASAPPGFSVPSRAPPPGFSSHERIDPSFDALSGGPIYSNSSVSRNSYQALPVSNNNSIGDIEFIDPAIMAVVGNGRLPAGRSNPVLDQRLSFPSQYGSFENEARLQMLMQKNAPQQHNLRFSETGNNFSPSSNGQLRFMDQHLQVNNIAQFSQLSLQQPRNGTMSNGNWDGWNDSQSPNNIDISHLLGSERLGGYNQFYNGYDDSKIRMQSSGDLYNRTFGM